MSQDLDDTRHGLDFRHDRLQAPPINFYVTSDTAPPSAT